MTKLLISFFAGCSIWLVSCTMPFSKEKNARSKSIELIGGGTCTVQWLPDSYKKEIGDSGDHDYFRVIIHDEKEHSKEDWHYIDFGLQEDVSMVVEGDTLLPALFHRVANGRKQVYEYILAFQHSKMKNCTLLINDKLLGVGKQAISLP